MFKLILEVADELVINIESKIAKKENVNKFI